MGENSTSRVIEDGARTRGTEGFAPGSHPTIARMVALCVPPYPALDDSARRQVETEVAAFVTAQVAGMPAFLRLPYRVAIALFETLPLLLHGRRFSRLGGAAAAAWLTRLAESRLRPARDFVKLIRSCALFAYFDHPRVRAALEAEAPGAPP